MDVRTQQLTSFSKEQLIQHIILLEGEAEKLTFFSALSHFIAQHPQAQWKIFASVFNEEERARFYEANLGAQEQDVHGKRVNAQGQIIELRDSPAQNLAQNSPVQNSPAQNSPVQHSPVQNSPTQNSPAQNSPTLSREEPPREELLGGTLPQAELPRKETPQEVPKKEIRHEESQGKKPLDKLLQERLLHETILQERLLQKKALQDKLHLSQEKSPQEKLPQEKPPQEKSPQETRQENSLQETPQENSLQERLQHEKLLREKLLQRKAQEKPHEKPLLVRLTHEKLLQQEKSPQEKSLLARLSQEKPIPQERVLQKASPEADRPLQKKSQERLMREEPPQDRLLLQRRSQEKLPQKKPAAQRLLREEPAHARVQSPQIQGRLPHKKISSPPQIHHQLLLPQGHVDVINNKRWVYVRYAHHVTNVDTTAQRDPPNWTTLKTFQKNYFWDRIFDGVFTEAGAPPGAWFNVNLHKDHIPDSSAYPTAGAVNKEYHTLVIPLESLDLLNKNMYLITINSRLRKGAACAFVTPNSEEDRWCAAKMRRLDFRANDFFVFDEGWRYPAGDLPNILVVSSDPLAIPKTCEWKLSKKLANF